MLKAAGVHKIYRQVSNELHVLKGIDLEISQGDVVSIVGPSGAGKSTLLHILGGLDKPDEGTVNFDDQDLYALKENQLARIRNQKVGFIFQFYHLLPEFTALENVILPALVHRGDSLPALEKKGLSLLSEVGLKERARHKPGELSGGEQQRVAIARALVNEPRIIFCDEPTGNLDSESGEMVIRLLLELNARNHQTFVIVTHDDGIAKRSHKTIYMKDGNLVGSYEKK
jgi:lipoprotein-releasing system ATP-binding protein